MEEKEASPAEIIEAHQKRVEGMNVEEQIELAPHEDEYDFLLKIVRSSRQPMARRIRCAIEALPYKRPKLGAIATAQMSGKDFATLLERAIQRSSMSPEQLREAKQLRLIEGGKERIETQAVEVAGERR